MHISIVSPVYGCKESLYELYNSIQEVVKSITDSWELIFVNDSSPDQSWELIEQISTRDTHVKAISLSRNFGQHCAIIAGLEQASGEWIVVMDCDLQDRPEEISRLYTKAMEGYEVVLAQRKIRYDTFIKRTVSKYFYKVLGYLTSTKLDSTIANFGIYHKKVIKSVLSMNDYLKFFPAMIRWVGFSTTAIEVTHAERQQGKTSYSMRKLIRLGMQVILSFSEKPLHLVIRFGLAISFTSLLAGIFYLVRYVIGITKVSGFTSLIISIWFLAGVVIFIIGMVGLYIGKTFEKVKERPVYIIDKTLNLEK